MDKIDPIVAVNRQEASDLYKELGQYLIALTTQSDAGRRIQEHVNVLSWELKGEHAERFAEYTKSEAHATVQAFKLGLYLGRRYDANREEILAQMPPYPPESAYVNDEGVFLNPVVLPPKGPRQPGLYP